LKTLARGFSRSNRIENKKSKYLVNWAIIPRDLSS
jgi:hypothetical protein